MSDHPDAGSTFNNLDLPHAGAEASALPQLQKLIAKWRSRADLNEQTGLQRLQALTAGQRQCADELEQALAEASARPSPPQTEAITCRDCAKPYSEFPLDVVLPRSQWLEIHPDENGMLCANCIVTRAAKVPGATVCHLVIEVTPSSPPDGSSAGGERQTTDDPSRCAICGWSLKERVEDGCVRGNCSMRPFPDTAYALDRAAAEYGPTLDLTRFRNYQPKETDPPCSTSTP